MCSDVVLANKDAVLEKLQRFAEDLTALQRSIIEESQDDAWPDSGRDNHDQP